ncbi:MAG: hypothetical protein LC808_37040 [Actinobacteria bacterium]|nr:hypothetical protein [Actinomycetota bacterium]
MKDYQRGRKTAEFELPEEIQVAVGDLAGRMREGLLALSVSVGMPVMRELIEQNDCHEGPPAAVAALAPPRVETLGAC